MRWLRHTDVAIQSLDATIARVNYRTGELWVVGDGKLRELTLSDRCQLWFNGWLAPLRCFHPLDRIRISYTDDGFCLVAEALYLQAEEPEPSRFWRNGGTHEMDSY